MSATLVLALLAGAALAQTPKDSSCVSCHQGATGVAYVQHDFADWSASAHAKDGVACQACHGGNPEGKDKAAAHAGMLAAKDPKSLVYYTNVPGTCGGCHQNELKAFKKSAHFKELNRSGRGPNCVTCHGSMANHVLAAKDLEMTCTLCHRRPTQAYATKLMLDNAKASLRRLDAALKDAKGKNLEVAQQDKEYREALDVDRRALEDWHTFQMERVLASARDVVSRVNKAVSEIQVKAQQKP